MTTYLQLCKDTARDSGVIPTLDTPETVVGQTGRLARIVFWVRDAYNDIQRHNDTWRWLEAEFSGSTIANVQSYDSTALSIASRFSQWIHKVESRENFFSIYETAVGQTDEGLLSYCDWSTFRRIYMVGSAASDTGKPTYITVAPDNKLYLHPTPDKEYTLRGRYRKAPQTLSANADVPEMPEQFHDLIKWRALVLLGIYDEAFQQIPAWEINQNKLMEKLEISQLPQPEVCGPLA